MRALLTRFLDFVGFDVTLPDLGLNLRGRWSWPALSTNSNFAPTLYGDLGPKALKKAPEDLVRVEDSPDECIRDLEELL